MDDEDLLRSDIVFNLNADLSIVESSNFDASQFDLQDLGDLFGKGFVGIASKDDHILSR